MKEKTVRYVIDLDNPPPLTPEQEEEIAALLKMKDEDIDLSDIPEASESFWKNARHIPLSEMFRARKNSTTVRLDADILAWLKADGKGYQTRLNAILCEAMLKELKK